MFIYHIFLGLPTIFPKIKVMAVVTCLPSLRPFVSPFVSPLFPLLAFCLFFFLLALACSCLAWFPLLLHRWKLLNLIILKRIQKRITTKKFVRKLRGLISQNLISDLIWTSFGPRLYLLRTALKLQPIKTQPGEALERLCNGLLLELLFLLLLLFLELLLLGKARFLGREARDLWKGWKLLRTSELVHLGWE